jgi:RNA polymerase sigma-70 factor (ECF subfamily)
MRVLPPEQVKVMELAYYSGYTHKEISDLLDLSLGTVKSCMRLGLQKIRDYFDVSGREVPRLATNDRDKAPGANHCTPSPIS